MRARIGFRSWGRGGIEEKEGDRIVGRREGEGRHRR